MIIDRNEIVCAVNDCKFSEECALYVTGGGDKYPVITMHREGDDCIVECVTYHEQVVE